MEEAILQIAERLKGMREIMEKSTDEMASLLDISKTQYIEYEKGEHDFSVTFLYKAADIFGISMTELMTGTSPKLIHFSIIRKGEGLPVERRKEFEYKNLSYRFKNRKAEVFNVKALEGQENIEDIKLNSHTGQEFDYILSGKLKIKIADHINILEEGDLIYYDSSQKHGMVAVDGDCEFLAVLIK